MSDDQQPKDQPRPWGRRIITALTALAFYLYPQIYQLPLAMLREGLVKYGGEVVKDWLAEKTTKARPSDIETGSIPKPRPSLPKDWPADVSRPDPAK
jgi:hypothetical protein